MKESSILFNGEMVRAILDGRKTQTRLLVDPQPEFKNVQGAFHSWQFKRKGGGSWLYPNAKEQVMASCPYGQTGDRLWVRECFCADVRRATLEITGVRVERLQEIGDSDCEAEGVRPSVDGAAKDWLPNETGWRRAYRQLWQSIYGVGSWSSNPWVWVVEFKRVEQ